MKLALMIEGQEGVSWEDWQRLARLAEDGGFDALMRSDHYLSVSAGDRGALDAWGTICALGPLTRRIRLGTLVSPVTFRPAAVLAKLALTADHVSGGRVDVGIGTGWHQAEHDAFGLELPPMKQRMELLTRQLADITRFWDDYGPAPVQQPRPRLVMGGQAKQRSAGLAALYADEYNLLYRTPPGVREGAEAITSACREIGREPIPISLMLGFAIGATEAEADDRRRQILEHLKQPQLPVWESWLVGTPEQVIEQLSEIERAGCSRVMLQHLLFDDDEAVELVTRDVLPAVA
jgi:alkanesulfonate monooxygenase SsuD/methylene tetrahydromethanopterin reductase-like flavin-dependent oxidoreductase (luciferase family)